MTTQKQFPKSIRFESEVEEKIDKLKEIFDESAIRVLHRAVNYLYDNKEAAIDDEAQKRKSRIAKG